MYSRRDKYRKSSLRQVLFVLAMLATAPLHAANVDLFMKISGVDGESTQKGFEKWTVIDEVNWGVSIPDSGDTGSTRRRGSPVPQDLLWRQVMDKSSVKVLDDLIDGRVREKIDIHFTSLFGGALATFFKMEFKNTRFTDFELNGSTGALPRVMGAFDFEEIKVTYSQFDNRGAKIGDTIAEWRLDSESPAAVASLFGLGLSGPATVVPVPAAFWLLGGSVLALGGFRSRRRVVRQIG